MNREIDEFREIVDGEWPGGAIQGRRPNEEEMRRALQVLLTRQCLYASTPGLGRTYEIVRAYASFFERYFGALGYRLVIFPNAITRALVHTVRSLLATLQRDGSTANFLDQMVDFAEVSRTVGLDRALELAARYRPV